MLKKYFDYFKNNPEGYWFKKKLYGWGWTPVKWQGWLVIGLFILFMILNGMNLGEYPTDSQLTWFFVRTIIGVCILIFICYKTGEKPSWQWGIPKKDKPQ